MSQQSTIAQLMYEVLDRLASGEDFNAVVEQTGITARVGEAVRLEKSTPVGQSITDHIVETIQHGRLRVFTKKEGEDFASITGVEGDEIQHGVPSTARIRVRGYANPIVVQSPYKVTEGLIQAFTPFEPEASMQIPTSSICGISFSE